MCRSRLHRRKRFVRKNPSFSSGYSVVRERGSRDVSGVFRNRRQFRGMPAMPRKRQMSHPFLRRRKTGSSFARRQFRYGRFLFDLQRDREVSDLPGKGGTSRSLFQVSRNTARNQQKRGARTLPNPNCRGYRRMSVQTRKDRSTGNEACFRKKCIETTTPSQHGNHAANDASDDIWANPDSNPFGNSSSSTNPGQWIGAKTLSAEDTERLLEIVQSLSNEYYLVEDVISACQILVDIRPSDEIREALGRCWTIKPFKQAKEASDFSSWRSLIVEVEKTATTIQSARSQAEPADQSILFDFKQYARVYRGKNKTSLQKHRAFEELWDNGITTKSLKSYCRASYTVVPRGMSFVVKDVGTGKRPDGFRVYKVKVEPLVFGEKNSCLGKTWEGSPSQTDLFVRMVKATGGIGRELVISSLHDEVEDWSRGTIISADDWIVQWAIEWADVTYKSGKTEESCKIWEPSNASMFRSDDERLECEQ